MMRFTGEVWWDCITHKSTVNVINSGIATVAEPLGGQRGQSATPDSKKIAKIRGKKSGKIRKKEEESGRKVKNREGSVTLPLLTDRAGYATSY